MTTAILPRRSASLPNLRSRALVALGIAGLGLALLEPPGLVASGPEAEVVRVVTDTCEAFRVGDEAALDRLLDARYTLVSSSGEVSGKAEQIANARALQQPGTVRVRDVEARVDGDTAIAVGVLTLRTADGTART